MNADRLHRSRLTAADLREVERDAIAHRVLTLRNEMEATR